MMKSATATLVHYVRDNSSLSCLTLVDQCSVSTGLRSEGIRKGIKCLIEKLIINSVRELSFRGTWFQLWVSTSKKRPGAQKLSKSCLIWWQGATGDIWEDSFSGVVRTGMKCLWLGRDSLVRKWKRGRQTTFQKNVGRKQRRKKNSRIKVRVTYPGGTNSRAARCSGPRMLWILRYLWYLSPFKKCAICYDFSSYSKEMLTFVHNFIFVILYITLYKFLVAQTWIFSSKDPCSCNRIINKRISSLPSSWVQEQFW